MVRIRALVVVVKVSGYKMLCVTVCPHRDSYSNIYVCFHHKMSSADIFLIQPLISYPDPYPDMLNFT